MILLGHGECPYEAAGGPEAGGEGEVRAGGGRGEGQGGAPRAQPQVELPTNLREFFTIARRRPTTALIIQTL